MAVGDADLSAAMKLSPIALTALLGLAACETMPSQPVLYPVTRLASLADPAAAHAAAAKLDRPLLILGNGIYALAEECIPQRYFGDANDGRLGGAGEDGRLTGSDQDGRLSGAGQDDRLGGSAADARLGGAAEDQRLGGAAADERLGGAAEDGRLSGGAQDGRLGGSDQDKRGFGASESSLRCRLSADLATIEIYGAAGAGGSLYSPRRGGALDGVLFY